MVGLPAARITDMHTCPMCMGAPMPIIPPAAITVFIGGLIAARMGDLCTCVAPIPVPVDAIVMGSFTVLICKQPAARMTDLTAKGGAILPPCCPTVLIGMVGMGAPSAPSMSTLLLTSLVKPKGSTFGDKFKAATGMTVEQSTKLYEADTGKKLSPETVETLFTDSAKAKELLMADKDLHTVYRSILNTNVPATRAEAQKLGYSQPTFLGSKFLANWYHDPWNNEKWVSPDGHLEAVYDANGDLVNSLDYKGTFNFFGPDQTGAHKAADVDPYNKWGN